MDSKENFRCPICGVEIKKSNGAHIKQCIIEYVNNLSSEEKEKIIHLYVNEGYSMVEMSKYLGKKYSTTEKILRHLGLKRRTIKEATNNPRCREKYRQTCIEHFGAEHNFSKDCSSRKKWEQKLFEEEGIVNVFQRDSVKKKIRETMLKRYGEDGITENRRKGNFIEFYIKKYGEIEGEKYFQWVTEQKRRVNTKEYYIEKYGDEWESEWEAHLNRIGKSLIYNVGLNDKCEEILKRNGIEYTREYSVYTEERRYLYDFKIGNILLELNGTYWHCSPKKYKPNDLVHFPNNVYIKPKDKWEQDAHKMEVARENNFIGLTIWEEDFNENTLINLLENLNYGKN